MAKRAVMMSFELWKEILTTGWRAEWIECIEGLPEDAQLVETFNRGILGIELPDLVMIFESPQWKENEEGFTVKAPSGEDILEITPVMFTQRAPKDHCYTLSYTDREEQHQIRVHGLGHMSITTDWVPESAKVDDHLYPLDPLPHEIEIPS